MKTEELFLTIEQAKHLQELGLDMSDAAFCWSPPIFEGDQWGITPITEGIRDVLQGKQPHVVTPVISTYSLHEVLSKLPKKIIVDGSTYKLESDCEHWICYYTGDDENRSYLDSSNRIGNVYLNAVFDLLCWISENGYYEEKKK